MVNILSEKQKIIRVFIGSPSGLESERQAAHDVTNSVNRSHGDRWGLQFKLLGWEDTVPGYVRPQSKINDDLDRCDYFIGVLYNHWGSRPTIEASGFTSGFEEEYARAEQRISEGLMKDMALYFKAVDIPTGFEPSESLRKVLDFRKKCVEEKRVYFKDFIDLNSFRDIVREKLEEIGWRETELFPANELPEDGSNRPVPITRESSAKPAEEDSGLLNEEARKFLNQLMMKPADWESTSAYEVARLRLIATAVGRSGNDEFYLGNHDANLIFKKFRDANLSDQEVRALIVCGVVGFQHQNVPLWRWLAKDGNSDNFWLHVNSLAIMGNDTAKRFAIEILRIASRPIPMFHEFFDKKRVLSIWLAENADTQVFEAALLFLASNADVSDLPLIEEAASQSGLLRSSRVEEAIIGILSRSNINSALHRLTEKEVDKISAKMADELFASPQSLTTAIVLPCLSAKSESIRLRAVQLLSDRKAITIESAETLLTDSNHEVRLMAAEILAQHGSPLDDEIAKKVLRVVKPRNGLIALSSVGHTDDTYYDRYRESRLAELDQSTLESRARAAGVFDGQELSILFSKYASKMQNEIRKNLDDVFVGHFETRLQQEKEAGRITPQTEERVLSLGTFLRSQYCDHALNGLCSLNNASDIGLVRKVLEEVEIAATPAILSFLARFGDWSDIERIKKLGDYPRTQATRLGIRSTTMPREKATAILALGKDRVADVLDLDIDSQIRISLAKQLPKKVFAELRDEVLLRELERKQDEYRIVFALRCVQSLAKSRVATLLDRYADGSKHLFYNSIHWLDLGAALPSKIAKGIADRALADR